MRLLPLLPLLVPTLAWGRPVRLVVHVPPDTTGDVYLAGSLPQAGGWRADGVKLVRRPDGTYAADLILPDGHPLEFKFNRGDWATVEKNADGSDVANRTLAADATAADLTVARWSAGPATRPASTVVGTLVLHTLDALTLGGRRTVRVWLPDGYDPKGPRMYAPLYVFDGQNCFDRRTSAFGTEWQMDETLAKLLADKAVYATIVIALDNGPDRIGEYTYTADPKHDGGHAGNTEAFLTGTVMPFVEKNYRVNRFENCVGGSSLGGLMALDLARHRPSLFARVMAMSPSLWWDGEAMLNDWDKHPLPAGPRVWIDMGTAEEPGEEGRRHVERIRRLDALLTRDHVEHRVMIDEGARHNEAAWAERFPDAMLYLLGPSAKH